MSLYILLNILFVIFFFFSSRRRHTRYIGDWSSDVCSSDLILIALPPNWCGGAIKMRITATPSGTSLNIDAILTIFCIIGPNPPNSHDDPTGEGITLVVPGIVNFNEIVFGMNHYEQLN